MALGVQNASGPTYSNSTDITVDNPVMEVPAIYDSGQGSPSFAFQTWMIQAPGAGSPLWQQPGYFELVVAPSILLSDEGGGFTDWVMNAPGNSISANLADNEHLPIHVSSGNGGFPNEVWALTNTARVDSAPFMKLQGTLPGQDLSTLLSFSISNFSEGQVLSLPLNIIGGSDTPLGMASGNITPDGEGGGTCQIDTGNWLPGPGPHNAEVVVVAINAQGYVVAFTKVSSDYWYDS